MSLRSLILIMVLSLSACAPPADPLRKPAVDELGLCDMEFTNSRLCIALIWERKPTETEYGSFILEFFNPEDRGQFMDPPGTLSLNIHLAGTGQTSASISPEKLSTGQYRFSKVFFTMRGDWEIQLKLLNGSNIVDEAVNPVHF